MHPTTLNVTYVIALTIKPKIASLLPTKMESHCTTYEAKVVVEARVVVRKATVVEKVVVRTPKVTQSATVVVGLVMNKKDCHAKTHKDGHVFGTSKKETAPSQSNTVNFADFLSFLGKKDC